MLRKLDSYVTVPLRRMSALVASATAYPSRANTCWVAPSQTVMGQTAAVGAQCTVCLQYRPLPEFYLYRLIGQTHRLANFSVSPTSLSPHHASFHQANTFAHQPTGFRHSCDVRSGANLYNHGHSHTIGCATDARIRLVIVERCDCQPQLWHHPVRQDGPNRSFYFRLGNDAHQHLDCPSEWHRNHWLDVWKSRWCTCRAANDHASHGGTSHKSTHKLERTNSCRHDECAGHN